MSDAKPFPQPTVDLRQMQKEIDHLRALVARHEQTIQRQQREIAALRSNGVQATAAGEAAAPSSSGTPQPTPLAQPVAGADYTIMFDGGAIGNPGRGYGSYQIVGRQGLVAQERLEFGDRVTNNQAEYRTLIAALEDLRDRLGREARLTSIAVRGDSQLVIHQSNGRWKVNNADLRPLHAQVRELRAGFKKVDLAWHGRAASVRVLGH